MCATHHLDSSYPVFIHSLIECTSDVSRGHRCDAKPYGAHLSWSRAPRHPSGRTYVTSPHLVVECWVTIAGSTPTLRKSSVLYRYDFGYLKLSLESEQLYHPPLMQCHTKLALVAVNDRHVA